jgi:hypothetical protein
MAVRSAINQKELYPQKGTVEKLIYLAYKSIPMIILFCYLYRYGAHFKEYHEIAFTNVCQLPVAVIEQLITMHLTGGRCFVPDDWQLPNLFFTQGQNTQSPYHEFVQLKTQACCTTIEGDIALLLHTIQLHAAIHKVL